MKTINIAVIDYPGGMKSAIEGLSELFGMASRLSEERPEGVHFEIRVLPGAELTDLSAVVTDTPQVIILPPCIEGGFYTDEQPVLSEWLKSMHAAGVLLCSVCAGAFILAQTGLLNQRAATTHWMLADRLAQRFPDIRVDDSKILINDGDLITAGGLMAWLDLGLELVAQFGSPALMRQLGKHLVVDTAPRQQRYYRCFMPPFDHGDRAVLKSQHYLQSHSQASVTVKQLAEECHLTERTFLRRFVRATGYKPKEYIQQLRISKACDALESSADSIELIALSSGYDDVSAFRKVFIKITGLTPREFRRRFSAQT
ncbi:Transcriptional regulator GlxA family, contains an amidase domain and an AraC-type DNA-binding HTH domain [Amphritea atlantica]|uniref:Transcriptional regulator GlxA family, contains an amidase domain and an AraC-type DNA-binding HTH domain n=1 Tax=Amphritea atlantica TaxID=355243 RepID=A0A1H9JJB6_9GAMM|nr:helix-turn-helix domain-containing protein [Amphritea atlantica]SEQ86838.1 Transcriptional regulator GlxA family, contains an amidase domain and an AraC-type DNA-binding HTH domain [Amphritea atlantica]